MDKRQQPKSQRPVLSVEGGSQFDMFEPEGASPGKRYRRGTVGFVDPQPHEISIGSVKLRDHLEQMDLRDGLLVREVMREQDWREFEEAYRLTGRRPYHPSLLAGLVIYGTMDGKGSLRALEELAKRDLGAMWVTGGVCPDHTTLGRFLQLHAERMTDEFFQGVTVSILKRLKSKPKKLAGDGTVIEAATSRFQIIKKEAAEGQAKDAQVRATAAPDDRALQRQAQHKQAVADAAEQRAKKRETRGQSRAKTRVCSVEPDAAVLKSKRGQFVPGYVPSILATEERIIVGQHVDPTSELAAVDPMLRQAEAIVGLDPDEETTLLFDGGYSCGEVAQAAAERNMSLLCPIDGNGKKRKKKSGKKKTNQKAAPDKPPKFPKSAFRYDYERDVYICPGQHKLKRSGPRRDKRRDVEYFDYKASRKHCRVCPLKDQCVPSAKTARRSIARYKHDDARDALREVMRQPRARQAYRQRAGMVEPVFAELRGVQGLNRFRRFGLRGVRLEFALHACAHNLRRLLALAPPALGACQVYAIFSALLCALFALDNRTLSRRLRITSRRERSALFAARLSAPPALPLAC